MDDRSEVSAALRRIVAAGMAGEAGKLAEILHDDVVMVLPGFGGRVQGKKSMLSGFEDFSRKAAVREHHESDEQVDVVGDVAVGSYRFDVMYSRDGASYRSSGRDIWIFLRAGGRWVAVWRTMLELVDEGLEG